MSTRRLLARLNRLEKTSMPTAARSGFRIDPALAKALRDDKKRLDELERSPGRTGTPSQEEVMLQARIDRMADTIVCPPSYGVSQVLEDQGFLADYRIITDEAKHAQVVARIAAYDRTPEGRARQRIREIEGKKWDLYVALFKRFTAEDSVWESPAERSKLIETCSKPTPEEQRELDHLLTLYPYLAPDPDDFLEEFMIGMLLKARNRTREDERD